MAKLHSASPREITSPFTREIISVLNSKACNWRASEASETLSGLFNLELRYIIVRTYVCMSHLPFDP